MTWETWIFSAKRAWARPLIRWTTIGMFVIIGIISLIFLWRVIPARKQSGTLVFHYNIYLGIDEVHPWGWIFLLPGIWILLTLLDLFFVYGWYQEDAQFSWSLLGLAFLTLWPCAFALLSLARINT